MQIAVSSVIGEFLQQFFTFLVGIVFVIRLGGHLSWALLLFVPVVITSARKIGREVRTRTRTGQDKLAEIQNILHETVTGNRIVKAFNTEIWEILRFKKRATRLFRANLRSVRIQSISSPLMDTIGAIAIAMFLFIGRNEILHGRMTMGLFGAFIILLFKLYDPVRKFAYFYNSFQQAMGASASIFGFFDVQGRREGAAACRVRCRVSATQSSLRMSASPTPLKKASIRFCTTSISTSTPAKCWRWLGPAARGSRRWSI